MSLKKNARNALLQFIKDYGITDKGALSVVVTLSRKWQSASFPIKAQDIETPKGGQVKGLGGPTLKKILFEHGIEQTLSSEGGRTSRGSLEIARRYAELLNQHITQSHIKVPDDLKFIEAFWVECVKEYFNRKGFEIHIDPSLSITKMVDLILEQAQQRQREMRGHMIVGTVLEHLVGAKLSIALGSDNVDHKVASTADESSGAAGDFEIQDTIIHVTTTPSQPLVEKCESNIRNGLRPIIICPSDLKVSANSLADSLDLSSRIDVYGAQEFISMNVNEWSGFSSSDLLENTVRLIERYNEIVEDIESDRSFMIVRKGKKSG